MISHAAPMKLVMDAFAGVGAACEEMNEDLRFHALSQVTEARPGLLARMGAGLATLLARRSALPGAYAGNAHLLRDLGFAGDMAFAVPVASPFVTAPFLPALQAVPAGQHADLGLSPLPLDMMPAPVAAVTLAAPAAQPHQSPRPLAVPVLQY